MQNPARIRLDLGRHSVYADAEVPTNPHAMGWDANVDLNKDLADNSRYCHITIGLEVVIEAGRKRQGVPGLRVKF